jgi:hypothetical protein
MECFTSHLNDPLKASAGAPPTAAISVDSPRGRQSASGPILANTAISASADRCPIADSLEFTNVATAPMRERINIVFVSATKGR